MGLSKALSETFIKWANEEFNVEIIMLRINSLQQERELPSPNSKTADTVDYDVYLPARFEACSVHFQVLT